MTFAQNTQTGETLCEIFSFQLAYRIRRVPMAGVLLATSPEYCNCSHPEGAWPLSLGSQRRFAQSK